MRPHPLSLSMISCAALLLMATAVRAQAPAGGNPADDWTPYGAEPAQPAPSAPTAEPAQPAPPSSPQPAESPLADNQVPAEEAVEEGVPIHVGLAQYGVACVVPLVLSSIPFIGWIAQAAIPLAVGWLVQVVGDAMLDRSTSPVAPIVGAFIGNCVVMPACTVAGSAVYFGMLSAGMLTMFGARAGGFDIRAGLAAFMGLGATGIAALLGSIVVGFAAAAAVPVAAYAIFSEDQGEESEVEEASLRPATRRVFARPGKVLAAPAAMAY